MPELRFEIPGNPPSGNHYKTYRIITPRGGKPFVSWYLTKEAKEWYRTVMAVAAGRKIRGSAYTLSYVVFTKHINLVSDVDNYAKCIVDSLAEEEGAGVIDNDKKVIDLHGYRRVDRLNPRTVIIVRTEQEQLFEVTK